MMVLAGQLNKQLVAAIGAAGQPAIGICGGDLAHVSRREETISRTWAMSARFAPSMPSGSSACGMRAWCPVVSSLALGFDGEYYNVNADQMASACAVACGAHALIYLTDVPGVKDADGSVIRWLDVSAIAQMVAQATVSGGMLPKLEACTRR